jgi:hypothetical protein
MFLRFGSLLILGVLSQAYSGFAQVGISGQERLVQPIIINGQEAQGVMVVENGRVVTHTCSAPQQYVTVDQSSSGWACFEPATGMWLLRALPPTNSTYAYQQPQVYVSPPVVPVYPYAYSPYGYYPYSYYPYVVGPHFGIGFGFGFGFPVVRSPFVINRAPVIIGGGRSVVVGRPFVSRPIGGFRSVGPGRVSGRFGRR